jgi:hypothetical protein
MRTFEDRVFLALVIAVSLAFGWILWPFYGAILRGVVDAARAAWHRGGNNGVDVRSIATAADTTVATLYARLRSIKACQGDQGANHRSSRRSGCAFEAFKNYYGPTMNAFEAAEKNGRANDLQKELGDLFDSQNKSTSKEFNSIPAHSFELRSKLSRRTYAVRTDPKPR